MASPNMNSISRHDVNTLLRQVQGNSLFNRQLSSVCQVNGLKSTGVKAELQRRIVHRESFHLQHADRDGVRVFDGFAVVATPSVVLTRHSMHL